MQMLTHKSGCSVMVDSTPSSAQYMRRSINTSRYHCPDFVTLSIATPVQSRKPAFKNPVVCQRVSHSSNSFKPTFNYGVRAAMGSVQDEKQATDEKVKELIEYLKVDLPKLFDKGELDKSRFESKIRFEDPITKYDSVGGYLLNIQMLRLLFSPQFHLRNTYQSGPSEITTRWTMKMDFKILPWRPEIVFSGLSIYGINPESGRFDSHVDIWDSISDQKYFSLEGLRDLLSQSSQLYGTPGKPWLEESILTRRAAYEVRQFAPFVALRGGQVGADFEDMKRYVDGQNSTRRKVGTLLPFITANEEEGRRAAKLIILSPGKTLASFPEPSSASGFELVQVPSQIAGVVKWGGAVTEGQVAEKERELRGRLLQDGLKPHPGFRFFRYEEDTTLGFLRRNEVVILIDDFSFDDIRT